MKTAGTGRGNQQLINTMTLLVAIFMATATITVGQGIQRIGYNLANITSAASNCPGNNKFSDSIFLLDAAVTNPGILFAFSAFFANDKSVVLQVYRPVTGSTYRLIAEITTTPTVLSGHEDIYIESFLNKQCIGVQPGDRLGIYINSDPPSVLCTFDPNSKIYKYSTSAAITINNQIQFDTTAFPYSFYADAYILANGTGNASVVNTDCLLGLLIPKNSVATLPATTTPPITGAPGQIGDTGVIGSTGSTGSAGATGSRGNQGSTGQTGVFGNAGSIGQVGNIGSPGATGFIGTVGATGNTGVGERGANGVQGLQGPPGAPGNNFIVFINNGNRPSAQLPQLSADMVLTDSTDAFWSSSRAIWSSYIWLALLTALLAAVIIILVSAAYINNSISSIVPAKDAMSKTSSGGNIIDNTCNYSELGSVEH